MKHSNYFIGMILSLSLLSCNKDEDIVIDNPEDKPELTLNYQVVEYLPAPGQYINEVANGSAQITSAQEACEYAETRFLKNDYVSLGGWGGFIIVKFNESIPNSGGYDFAISSNSFDSSNEPGIVWVMSDTNKNGLPDDVWYELKGSYFGEEGYERNYWVTYHRPGAKENTPWEDSNGETGEINWLGNYHSQDYYYPQWIKEDNITFYGSRLPSRAEQDEVTGIWQNKPFEWGYADNFGEDFIEQTHQNRFKISDAITETNEEANLKSIDFVKVQTAINGTTKLLGENSTEVMGFFKL